MYQMGSTTDTEYKMRGIVAAPTPAKNIIQQKSHIFTIFYEDFDFRLIISFITIMFRVYFSHH